MSFRIDRQKALGQEFRKVLRAQVGRAIRELNDASPEKSIHGARVRLKKVRAALKLLNAAAPHEISEKDHGVLRDAAKELGEIRDANVNLRAMKNLCDRFEVDQLRFGGVIEMLVLRKTAVSAKAATAAHNAATLLKAMQSRIDAWENHAVTWKELLKGMEHIYMQSRKAFREAKEELSDEAFHRWRKRTKDLLFNLKLMEDGCAKTARALTRQAKKLGTVLGEEHDLAQLAGIIKQQATGKEKAVIEEMIAKRRAKLQKKALKRGKELFSPKPGDFVAKIAD